MWTCWREHAYAGAAAAAGGRCLLHDEYFDCAHVSQDVVDKRLNQHDAVIISPSSRVFISQSIQTSFPAIFFSNSSSRLCILNAWAWHDSSHASIIHATAANPDLRVINVFVLEHLCKGEVGAGRRGNETELQLNLDMRDGLGVQAAAYWQWECDAGEVEDSHRHTDVKGSGEIGLGIRLRKMGGENVQGNNATEEQRRVRKPDVTKRQWGKCARRAWI
jgi:hypothetical protein